MVTQTLTEEQMRERLRQKYPEHFRHAWTLFEFAQEVLDNFKGAANKPYEISVWLICGKAFKSYHAILNLCEIAYTEDAGVILRSLFNLLVIQRWILAQDSDARARRYLGWFWLVMNEQLQQHEARISPELADMVRREYKNHREFFEYQDNEGNTKMRKKWYEPEARSIEQMAEQVEMKSHYDGLYRPLSSIEHSDAAGFFAMVSDMERKNSGPSLGLHSDLFVPAYLRNAFQYFADVFQMWNETHHGADEAKFNEIVQGGMGFFRQEVEQVAENDSRNQPSSP